MVPTTSQEREARRTRKLRPLLGILVSLAALSAAIDGFFIEPFAIVVTRHHVAAPGIQPLRIAHLTDLHTNGLGPREERLLSLLEAEKPDLIVITGDILKNGGDYERARDLLVRLRAPLGVWAVRGNRERTWRPLKHERTFFRTVPVNLLMNESQEIRQGVWLVGVDDPSSGAPDMETALGPVPPGAFVIALFHAPAYLDKIAGRCQLALAGHTHGGQVRPPLVPVFWLPRGVGRYLEGWYQKGGTRLYVSRGIGTSYLPVRFLCRPELPIITVGDMRLSD